MVPYLTKYCEEKSRSRLWEGKDMRDTLQRAGLKTSVDFHMEEMSAAKAVELLVLVM